MNCPAIHPHSLGISYCHVWLSSEGNLLWNCLFSIPWKWHEKISAGLCLEISLSGYLTVWLCQMIHYDPLCTCMIFTSETNHIGIGISMVDYPRDISNMPIWILLNPVEYGACSNPKCRPKWGRQDPVLLLAPSLGWVFCGFVSPVIWVNYNDLTVLPHWNHG